MRTFSPFTTRSLFNELNTLFEESPQTHQLYATDSGWVIRLDIPGFERSELKLHFEEKALHLIAEKPEEADHPRASVRHKFALGEEVDSLAISAKLELGVLEITLPRKKEVATTKHINIQ